MRRDGNILACFGFFLRTRGDLARTGVVRDQCQGAYLVDPRASRGALPPGAFSFAASSFRRLYLLTDPLAGLIGWTMGSGPLAAAGP
jgi:hypothetical protein